MKITEKILVVGLGSIGQRHFRNLQALGVKNISAVSSKSKLPEDLNLTHQYSNFTEALESRKDFNAAIVCTPTAAHLSTMNQLVEKGIPHIYLEKPVSHELEGVDKLQEEVEAKNIRVKVGFDLHFDPGVAKVRELLENMVIGQLVAVNSVVGQYLPDWRPHEDYRQGMSTKKALGGGVMLELIHEFDYLRWVVGDVEELAGMNTNSGSLEIETEDLAQVICRFHNGVLGNITLDYLQRKMVRNCRLTGNKGSIFWNLAESKIEWWSKSDKGHFDYSNFARNDRFVEIMKTFLKDEADDRLTSLEEGIKSLKIVVAAKESSKKRSFIKL